MADSRTEHATDAPVHRVKDVTPGVIHEILDGLVGSVEPAVVFASLVRLSVPAICDVASATITGPDEKVYALSWPRDAVVRPLRRRTDVVVRFDAVGIGLHGAFDGEVTLGFTSDECCSPYVAQLLVDRVMATVERERLLDLVRHRETEIANLQVALATHRKLHAVTKAQVDGDA